MLFSFFSSLIQRVAAVTPERQGRGITASRTGFCGLLMFWLLLNGTASAGTWTRVVNQNPQYYTGTMLLLTDGSVMVHSGNDYQTWTKLTPDSTGSYVNGTWTTLGKMGTPRRNFASLLLTDGTVLVLGGEFTGSNVYSSFSPNNSNTGEIYNPATNKWKAIAKFPGTAFGAGPAVLNEYGYVIAGSATSNDTFYYYPPQVSNGYQYGDYWSTFGGGGGGGGGFGFNGDPKLRKDDNTKETWLLLPNYRGVLSYDITASIKGSYATPPALPTLPTAQRFSLYTYDWTDSGTVPLALTTIPMQPKPPATTFTVPAIGPGSVLPNGKVIQIGGNNKTAIYTPSTSSTGTGSWVMGPSLLPASMVGATAPGAMLPDGHFFFLAEDSVSGYSTTLFDYNYTSNTLTDLGPTLPSSFYLRYSAPSDCRMLVLPDGGLLLSTLYYGLYEYKTSGTPMDDWRPTISSVSKSSSNKFRLYGSRLTGISEGATFGCDARMSSNYPIVRLDRGGVTTYARTVYWSSPGISSPGYNNSQYLDFEIPAGFSTGIYQARVIANGIPSLTTEPVDFKLGVVTASFANGTLTITGDDEINKITVNYKQVKDTSGVLKSASATITANDPFTLVNGKSSVTFDVGIKRINVKAVMGAGDDSIALNSFFASTITVDLGDGADTASFLYNSIQTLLAIDGGLAIDGSSDLDTDIVTLSGNSIVKRTTVNVP